MHVSLVATLEMQILRQITVDVLVKGWEHVLFRWLAAETSNDE